MTSWGGMMTRLEATVHGLVQGVFFRYYTQLKARELGLAGTVINQPDGTVFVNAEGASEDLHVLLEWLKQGPELARVDQVDATWHQPLGERDDFAILR